MMFYVKCYVNTLYNNDKDLCLSRLIYNFNPIILAYLQVVQIAGATSKTSLSKKYISIRLNDVSLNCVVNCHALIK